MIDHGNHQHPISEILTPEELERFRALGEEMDTIMKPALVRFMKQQQAELEQLTGQPAGSYRPPLRRRLASRILESSILHGLFLVTFPGLIAIDAVALFAWSLGNEATRGLPSAAIGWLTGFAVAQAGIALFRAYHWSRRA